MNGHLTRDGQALGGKVQLRGTSSSMRLLISGAKLEFSKLALTILPSGAISNKRVALPVRFGPLLQYAMTSLRRLSSTLLSSFTDRTFAGSSQGTEPGVGTGFCGAPHATNTA